MVDDGTVNVVQVLKREIKTPLPCPYGQLSHVISPSGILAVDKRIKHVSMMEQ